MIRSAVQPAQSATPAGSAAPPATPAHQQTSVTEAPGAPSCSASDQHTSRRIRVDYQRRAGVESGTGRRIPEAARGYLRGTGSGVGSAEAAGLQDGKSFHI